MAFVSGIVSGYFPEVRVGRVRWLLWTAAALGALGWGRWGVVHWVFDRTQAAAREAAQWSLPQDQERRCPDCERPGGDPAGLPLLAFWLEAERPAPGDAAPHSSDPSPDHRVGRDVEALEKRPASSPAPGVQPSVVSGPRYAPEPPVSVVLSAESVLRLAEQGAAPRGRAREASGGMPAGIEILDGGGLGIGWFPGDRLTHVQGVPVSERRRVIARVLKLRARGVPSISATIARRTKNGVARFQVVVEQPYLVPSPEGASETPLEDSSNSAEETSDCLTHSDGKVCLR